MALISSVDARAKFTKALIDVYQERIRPTTFLQSFFTVTPPAAANVAVEVERMGEKIAVDVVRGTEGNRNTFSKSTEKIWTPPLYSEYFDITNLDLYDRVLGSQGNANENLFAALLNSAAERLSNLQDKIERAKELQCAQILRSGTVSLTAADTIDYKRKAASIVDLNAGSNGGFFEANSNVFDQLEAGCTFLRQYGHSTDATFVAIFGEKAWRKFLANTVFLGRQGTFNMKLDQITAPRRNSVGASFMGVITAGSYNVECWTYPQIYDSAAGVKTPYVATNYVYMLPSNPRFFMAHGLVPQVVEPGTVPNQSQYVYDENMDRWNNTHVFRVRTAPLAVPVAVDQIYTMKASSD
jgi:hypothetical protein